MAIEAVTKTNYNPQTEAVKPKVEVKKTELEVVNNRNSVVGDRTNAGNALKFKLNNLYDGVFAPQQSPAPPKPPIDAPKKADELINQRGGVNDLNEDGAHAVGKDVAELAKTDPEGAVAVMNEVQNRLKDTNLGDNVADGFAVNSSDTDLQTVARVAGGADMLKNLQDHLLSGSVHQNEVVAAQRFGAAVTSANGIFADNGDGIGAGQANHVSPYSPDATPEEAASFLKYDTAFNTSDAQSQAFAEALELHKNDPEWTKNFLSAVGREKTTEYISGLYSMQYANKDLVNKYSATVRSTLENLVASGDLKQAGMDALVNDLKDKSPYVFTEIFGKSANPEFKEMFIRSAVVNGDDRLDAAASLALSTMSTERQSAFLTELDKNGKLNSFIEGAMAGQTQQIPLDYHLDNPNAAWNDAPKINLGGVEKLLQTAGIQTGYNGSTLQQAPFSRDLQQKLFYAAAKGLTNGAAFENFKGNVAFKDAISTVFLQHFDDIFKNSISDNGSSLNGDTKWLGAFFENTMFAQPPGTKASDVLATVYSKVASIAKATDLIKSGKQPLTAEEQKLVDDYKRSSPKGANWETGQAAGVIGEWLGNFDRAYTNAVKKIGDEAASNKSMLDLMIGTVDKLTGLAKLTPGASIAKDLLVDQLKNLPAYLEGKQVASGKAKLSNSADVITDLNNLIWDTVYSDNKDEYSQSFEFIAGHRPTESGLK